MAVCELGSETLAGWSMHIGGTQMASALNMDEGSDTTTHTDIVEEREKEGNGRKGRQKGRSIKWNLR